MLYEKEKMRSDKELLTLSLYALCKLVIARLRSPLDTLARVSKAPSANCTSSSAQWLLMGVATDGSSPEYFDDWTG